MSSNAPKRSLVACSLVVDIKLDRNIMEILPSQTLYINNVNEKIKSDVLKKMLYMIFSQYGKVVDIVAKKGLKLRGQSWVVFQETSAATNALRGKQGFNFYGKPMKIQYAKNKSDSAAKADGTFDIRLKRKRDEENAANSASSSGANKVAKIVSNSVPNRILFAQELPANCNETVLNSLFQQCQGFTEVRMVPGKIKLAFIEFNDETQATLALRQLHGFELSPGNMLQLTYGNV